MIRKVLTLSIIPLFIGMACSNLEQEIDLELPDYDSRFVLECYLEPGRPYTLLFSESAAYFDPFPSSGGDFIEDILVQDARVLITHRGRAVELENRLGIVDGTGKLYNYRSVEIVPQHYEEPFFLEITTGNGDTLRAATQILIPVLIDSVVVEFKERDTLARVLTYLTDPPGEKNYYRRILNKGSLNNGPEQDFPTDDRFVDSLLLFGTGYDFTVGDTVINTIYHIDEAYFSFLETLRYAAEANGNPFAQPSPVVSRIEGNANAIGVFTGLSYHRVTTLIER